MVSTISSLLMPDLAICIERSRRNVQSMAARSTKTRAILPPIRSQSMLPDTVVPMVLFSEVFHAFRRWHDPGEPNSIALIDQDDFTLCDNGVIDQQIEWFSGDSI